jgi:8-oxo-dGTP pyrophosphatase MutT (NUDIX family)
MVSESTPARLLDSHRPTDDVEHADLDRVRRWLDTTTDPWDRAAPLHLTASAFVVHPATGRVLLRWHPRQRAWLHVGGHGDPGEGDPVAIALREAREETALTDVRPGSSALLHVAIVPVATSGSTVVEHADLRFLFVTDRPDDVRAERPDAPLRWVNLPEARELTTEDNVRRSLRRVEAAVRGAG